MTPRVLAECSETVTPQGIIAASRKFVIYNLDSVGDAADLNEDSTTDVPLLIALDSVQDPGNLGTIIRTVCAAGIQGLLLGKGTVDVYNPKVIRAAMGAAFRLPLYGPVDLAKSIALLRSRGYVIYAAAGEAVKTYTEIDFRQKLLVIVGNEGRGVSPELRSSADDLVAIPMARGVESLNAGISASLIAYEAFRQNNNPSL